ncbi:selenite/tellurite reduction operon rhodanese-like protein ExtH [Trichloromonas sp.]|uniref:selenite/tellurite reduction operon rhodanese-like protein ExtH n=1 Tax=Trichloromonas sp. TaxID=3069249 RepID=UPI003D816957
MLNKFNRSSLKVGVQLLLVVTAAILVWGCGGGGSSSYDSPASTSSNALIGPATLSSWINEGLVGNDTGYGDKVVILDFRSPAGSDRIAGACRVEAADLTVTRFEGVADATPMVATGAQMDAVIQRLGIDDKTTIVFTTGGSAYLASRAYWTFRYWGFPKERLKLLDGGNTAFAAEYPTLMNDIIPSPTPSNYSVRNLAGINDDLRASVGEMIVTMSNLPGSTTDIVFDARGKDPAAGKSGYYGTAATPGLISGGSVVVDGHPVGGLFLNQSELFTAAGTYKTAEEIKALFAAKGWTEGMKTTVYCTSGYSATPLFFALDALLGADVQLFDGSWSQIGKYSEKTTAGGQLPSGSAWSIDRYLDPATTTYNKFAYITPLLIETLDAATAVAPQAMAFTGYNPADDSDVVQSQVEADDIAYAAGTGATAFAAPAQTYSPSVVIEADRLQTWMDLGLVNAAAGEKVVILDVTSAANYAAGHIPGAQLWDTAGQAVTRTEGPAPAVNMMLDGAAMDARIQALGIDENTTIVITSTPSNATFFPSRAYFTFRYWGFPKERLKVLNGYNAAWSTLTTDLPTITPSLLSVADLNTGAQLDTRVSLAELMDAVRDGRGTAIDMRGDSSAIGSTAGVFATVANDWVVFEGMVKGGTYYNYVNFNETGNKRFKSAAVIKAEMLAAGIDIASFSNDGSYLNPVYSYCRTGYIASTGFFVLDAILNIDVMTYDGSWSQWGKMSADASKGGELPAGSEWATDNSTYMSVINYNVNNATAVAEPLNPDAAALLLAPSAANQIEEADTDYQNQAPAATPVSGGTAPTSGSGSAGGGC